MVILNTCWHKWEMLMCWCGSELSGRQHTLKISHYLLQVNFYLRIKKIRKNIHLAFGDFTKASVNM